MKKPKHFKKIVFTIITGLIGLIGTYYPQLQLPTTPEVKPAAVVFSQELRPAPITTISDILGQIDDSIQHSISNREHQAWVRFRSMGIKQHHRAELFKELKKRGYAYELSEYGMYVTW